MTRRSLFTLTATLACTSFIAMEASGGIIITGLLDGDLSGGTPKAIELYITGTEDLSNYTMERSTNGAAFGSSTALSGVYTDQFVYIVGTANSGLAQFTAVFGNSGDFANVIGNSIATGNGNDAFRILDAGLNVVDQVAPMSATNSYEDSYLYRVNGTGPDGGWNASNWLMPGNAFLDGLDASGHAAAVPFGTYVIPAPGALALLGVAGVIGRRRRTA